jgi:hypothetical protein
VNYYKNLKKQNIMKELRKKDIEALRKVMPVFKETEQRTVIGGSGGTYPGQGFMDCALQTISYMTGVPLSEVHAYHAQILAQSYGYSDSGSILFSGTGTTTSAQQLLFEHYFGTCSTTSYNDVYYMENPSAFEGFSGTVFGSIKNSGGSNHAVAITSYNSGTGVITYWDQQNNISGSSTFNDLVYTISL